MYTGVSGVPGDQAVSDKAHPEGMDCHGGACFDRPSDPAQLRRRSGAVGDADHHWDEEHSFEKADAGLRGNLERDVCVFHYGGHHAHPGRSGGGSREDGARSDHPLVPGVYPSERVSCILFYFGGVAALCLCVAWEKIMEGFCGADGGQLPCLFIFYQLYGRFDRERLSGAEPLSGLPQKAVFSGKRSVYCGRGVSDIVPDRGADMAQQS